MNDPVRRVPHVPGFHVRPRGAVDVGDNVPVDRGGMAEKLDKRVREALEIQLQSGWWFCRECSSCSWKMGHRPEETECPKWHKPRVYCELSRKELGLFD